MQAMVYSFTDQQYNQFIDSIESLIEDGIITLRQPNPEEINLCNTTQIVEERVAQVAFYGAASLTKYGGMQQNITQWMQKRLTAFYIKLGVPAPLSVADYSHDLVYIGKFLDDHLALRKALYKPYLYKTVDPPNEDNLFQALRSQLQMILQNYSLTTFNLCWAFSIACETQVHIYEAIVIQSNHVLKSKDKIANQIKTHNLYDEAYYCVFNTRDPDLETVRYPDLAYCAISKQKATSGTSWSNYNVGSLQPQLTSTFITASIKITLEVCRWNFWSTR